VIDPGQLPAVRAVARELAARPELRLEVRGHTAPTQSRSADRRLGQLRARAVADELIRAGVSPERLIVRSLGSMTPVSRDPAKMATNRRVEFVVQGGIR
jgi:OmpA-OmpF porin, OOP family